MKKFILFLFIFGFIGCSNEPTSIANQEKVHKLHQRSIPNPDTLSCFVNFSYVFPNDTIVNLIHAGKLHNRMLDSSDAYITRNSILIASCGDLIALNNIDNSIIGSNSMYLNIWGSFPGSCTSYQAALDFVDENTFEEEIAYAYNLHNDLYDLGPTSGITTTEEINFCLDILNSIKNEEWPNPCDLMTEWNSGKYTDYSALSGGLIAIYSYSRYYWGEEDTENYLLHDAACFWAGYVKWMYENWDANGHHYSNDDFGMNALNAGVQNAKHGSTFGLWGGH